ncbi:MAG: M15 family metallopeptidase [Bacteroidaceae bacterium]|nr:M15 family metallopeptidase [Bacteroidaceae bacterium]
MKKYIFAALILCGCINIQCNARGPKTDENNTDSVSAGRVGEGSPTDSNIPDGARRLMAAYPDFISGYADGQLVMTDGTQMVYDDGREKSFEQKLDDADPEDMFAFTYDRSDKEPEYLQDAGRSRCEPLFKKMYGNSESQVRTHLIKVPWFGEQVLFTDVNGAADSLRAVAADIAAQPNFAQLKQYLKSSGTFYWRKVRGANRQSAHSYGMTIDIGVNVSDYWLWKNPGKKETDRIIYANRFPHELVHIFERHGFIWGGRWYHYDTMHFEYRPEFLVP